MRKKLIVSSCVFFLLIVSGFVTNVFANSSATYTVHRITNSGTFEAATLSTSDFDVAYSEMKRLASTKPNVVVRSSTSKSPLQIVAADRARVQSYPYRTGSANAPAASNTLKIFANASLSNRLTYIPSHYQMFYYETVKNGSGLVANVQINGVRGYVDMDQVDIIPLIYFENNLSLLLGGKEDYYRNSGQIPEAPYTQKAELDYFDVIYDSSANTYDIRVNVNRMHPSLGKGVTTFGIAPTWMPTGKYYSADGLTYFTDPELKQAVNGGKAYYSYYQWLPLRSQSNMTAENLNYYITKIGYHSTKNQPKYSIIVGNEQKFIDAANKYGFNVLLLFAQTAIESAYGSSNYAVERNNLIGWQADDSNPNNAASFPSLDNFLERYLSEFLRDYLWLGDWRNEGFSFGNKGSGIGVQYASDPYYGMKIAQIAYFIDYNAGLKDFEKYQLAVVDTSTAVDVLKQKNTSSGAWYQIPAGRKNQVVTVLENSSGYIKTNLSTPIRNGASVNEPIPVNLNEIIGYIPTSKVTIIDFKSGTEGGGEPEITVKDQNKTYAVDTGDGTTLSLRKSWSVDSDLLASIPDGTTLQSTGIVSNGWIRVVYNNMVGYVSGQYVKEKAPSITVTNQDKVYIVNTGDGTSLSLRASWTASSDRLAFISDKTEIQSTGIVSNGWIRVVYNGIVGYVSGEYVKEKTETVNPGVLEGDVNGDGKISLGDLALVKAYLLGNTKLTGNASLAADVNGDGKISLGDLALIKAHLLGNISLN